MEEVEDDPISQLLTILVKLMRKPLQLHWDNRVFVINSIVVPLYISLSNA